MFLEAEIIQTFYLVALYIGTAFLPIGLLYLIINRCIRHLNYRKKIIVNLIVGFIFTLTFVIAFLVDYFNNDIFDAELFYYIFFIAASFIYPAIIIITHLARRGAFEKKTKLEKKVTSKQKLYCVFKYEKNIYLLKEKENYVPFSYQLKDGFFHDEVIEKIMNKYHLSLDDVSCKEIGTAFIDKKEMIHSYLITVYEEVNFFDLIRVDAYDLIRIPMKKIDQEIVMKTIIGEEFAIERDMKE